MKGAVVVLIGVLVVLCVCVSISLGVTTAVTEEGLEYVVVDEQYVRIKINGVGDFDKLTKLRISLDHHRTKTEVDAIVTEHEKKVLRDNGYVFEELPKTTHEEEQHHLEKRATSAFRYHNYYQLTQFMQDITKRYPNITRLTNLGNSTHNRAIWCMHISDNPNVNEPLEPEFRYVANMHGDETVGREMLVQLIILLTSSYTTDTRIAKLINNTSIYIIPSMNPDGYELHRRGNANGVDLNRNFPDQFQRNTGTRQKEVSAMIKFFDQHSFVLAANFHGGSVVANYPFDGNSNYRSGQYSAASDDDVFRALAETYAGSNNRMKNSIEFAGGITNGAQWYVLYGGMQDYGYLHNGDLELTIELSDIKNPREIELEGFWNENKESMLRYLEYVHNGIYGEVKDSNGTVVKDAKIEVAMGTTNYRQSVGVDQDNGDYYKILLPGTYAVNCKASGMKDVHKTSVTVLRDVKTRLDFTMEPKLGSTAPLPSHS